MHLSRRALTLARIMVVGLLVTLIFQAAKIRELNSQISTAKQINRPEMNNPQVVQHQNSSSSSWLHGVEQNHTQQPGITPRLQFTKSFSFCFEKNTLWSRKMKR